MLTSLLRIAGISVCQEHTQIALDGLYPGASTFNIALNGFGCSIEIVVPPIPPSGGGGFYEVGPALYPITIIVRRKDKMWHQTIVFSPGQITAFIRVTASFKGIIKAVIEVLSKLNTILREDLVVKIFRKPK